MKSKIRKCPDLKNKAISKKLLAFLLLVLSLHSVAQEPLILQPMQKDSVSRKKDTAWKITGFFGVNASQTALSNWQGGGQNNIALNTILNVQAEYKKGNTVWTNKLDAQYGIMKPGEGVKFRKNIDQLFALSKYEVKAFNKYWFYATQADYRTQFAPGYNYLGDAPSGPAVSDMNSPGYLQLAIGLDYKPADYFSVTFAPAAGKATFVNRQYLADSGAYGVQKAVLASDGSIIEHGRRTRFEFGGRLILKFKKDIVKNVNLDSYLDLFSNYQHNPGNVDVVFNNLLTIKINKYFSVNVISQMLYDDDVIIRRVAPDKVTAGPRLQMLTTIAIGFGIKF